jgi:hypothetical protein
MRHLVSRYLFVQLFPSLSVGLDGDFQRLLYGLLVQCALRNRMHTASRGLYKRTAFDLGAARNLRNTQCLASSWLLIDVSGDIIGYVSERNLAIARAKASCDDRARRGTHRTLHLCGNLHSQVGYGSPVCCPGASQTKKDRWPAVLDDMGRRQYGGVSAPSRHISLEIR